MRISNVAQLKRAQVAKQKRSNNNNNKVINSNNNNLNGGLKWLS